MANPRYFLFAFRTFSFLFFFFFVPFLHFPQILRFIRLSPLFCTHFSSILPVCTVFPVIESSSVFFLFQYMSLSYLIVSLLVCQSIYLCLSFVQRNNDPVFIIMIIRRKSSSLSLRFCIKDFY